MLDAVAPWIHSYGYLALGILLALGIVGLPVPDETLLAYAGFLASGGQMRLPLVLLVTVAGSWCGISLSYMIGRTAGHWLLQKGQRRLPRLRRHAGRAHDWLARAGGWALTFCYFVPGVRHAAALVAGAVTMPVRRFALFAFPGGLAWVTTFILVGYYVGRQWERTSPTYHRIVLVVAAAAAVLAAGVWLCHRLRHKGQGGRGLDEHDRPVV